ncbi:hypothetical protein WJ96_04715 [Burkholderia ubonensis]|uniref:Fatty acid desaturase n=1 Tax=Burkholderia ubonensis TaxID=101571 RepID=A0AAW3MY01_9BURK|nr:hypothetical protein [Burkholderia ubonensis]KVP65673.1 hypothetical protein WJ93_24445 [Burkholderia ubonensis]KVP96531.1 hypothetical protein WJ97_11640 [Burkholderia ubonensis]KVP97875.1 hypothetical protein WJ96_04715 [Burkholderia ubonensis]KVZ92572.1 hypothetical protein WL25_16370 [Burkholderia ubonensis]
MTKKNIKNGQFAPQSKHQAVAELEKAAHLIGAIIGITAWFVAIWMAAVGLGFLIHWTQVHWVWVPHHMIEAGHVIENVIFVADCVSLLWSVGVHLYHHCKGELSGGHGHA